METTARPLEQSIPYLAMESGKLYRDGNHLYCLKGGRYYWLAFDHFSRQYMAPWKKQTCHDLTHLSLRTVKVRDHPPGIVVERDDAGRPVLFRILSFDGF